MRKTKVLYETTYEPGIKIEEVGKNPKECLFCGNEIPNYMLSIGSGICYSHVQDIHSIIRDLNIRGREQECDSSVHEGKILWIKTILDDNKTKHIECSIRRPEEKDICDRDKKEEEIILKDRCAVCKEDICENELMLVIDIRKEKGRGIREYSLMETHLTCISSLKKCLIELENQSSKVVSNIL